MIYVQGGLLVRNIAKSPDVGKSHLLTWSQFGQGLLKGNPILPPAHGLLRFLEAHRKLVVEKVKGNFQMQPES